MLPIHPNYAELIVDGKKTVELRRTRISRPVRGLVVYATAPISKIIGYAIIDDIVRLPIGRLFEQYQKEACIDEASFFEYYRNLGEGSAIIIGRGQRIEPISLGDILKKRTPPQSFCYLTNEEFELIVGRMKEAQLCFG